MSVRFDSLGALFMYGNGGATIPIKAAYKKTNNGNSWSNLFGGNAINGVGGATQTVSGFDDGDQVILRLWAEYSSRGSLSYDRKIYSNDGSSDIMILRNGDTAPTVSGAISTLIQARTIGGIISIGEYDLLLVGDFNRQDCNSCSNNYCSNCSGVDYQKGIVLVKFLTPSC